MGRTEKRLAAYKLLCLSVHMTVSFALRLSPTRSTCLYKLYQLLLTKGLLQEQCFVKGTRRQNFKWNIEN